eukprot:1532584-Prymnesium_polylepis.1
MSLSASGRGAPSVSVVPSARPLLVTLAHRRCLGRLQRRAVCRYRTVGGVNTQTRAPPLRTGGSCCRSG